MTKSKKENKEIEVENDDGEYVMVCPECKSTDVHIDKENPLQPAMGLPEKYVCENCGHNGYGFPEVLTSELENFEKEVDKKHLRKEDKFEKVDTSYGKFLVDVFWKIISPISIVLGLAIIVRGGNLIGLGWFLAGLIMFYFAYLQKE